MLLSSKPFPWNIHKGLVDPQSQSLSPTDGYPLWEGGGNPRDSVNNKSATLVGSVSWVARRYGRAVRATSTGTGNRVELPAPKVAGFPLALVLVVRVDTSSSNPALFDFALSSAADQNLAIAHNTSTGALRIFARNTTTRILNGTTDVLGKEVVAIAAFRGATDRELYVDGVSEGTDTSSVPFFAPDRGAFFTLFDSSLSNGDVTGHISAAYVLPLRVEAGLAQRITVDPFAPFRMDPRRLGFVAAAPAGIVVLRRRREAA